MRSPVAEVCLLALLAAALPGQNSTRKIRTPPGELASRVGSAVAWRADVAQALAEARSTGRPVFWYVPSVARSPMDRKPEIDRYARGGPFSWPTTIELLNTHFVPVAQVPAGDLQQRHGLVRQQYIEPGYLVLDGDGRELARVDQITSFHPQWFEAPLRRLVQQPLDGFPGAPALRDAWQAYRDGDRSLARERADAVLASEPSPAVAAEAHWLWGAAARRDGQRDAAQARWRQLAAALPEQPLAWKAALEVEGHGPFGRGFEDYLPLPAVVLAQAPHDGSRASAGAYDEPELWRRGVAFLCSIDDGDGVVRDSIYDFGGTDSLPNVHAAVTCLVGEALLAAAQRDGNSHALLGAALRARAEAMLQRILQQVRDDAWIALSDKDEILWARAYALRFLAAWQAHRGQADELRPLLQRATAALLALQPATGVWFHEYGNPFATATALQALHLARGAGIDVPQEAIDRGLRALAMNRTGEGAFSYAHTANGKPRASVEAAAGRMPLCELGLFVFGASDQERLRAAVEAGHRHHGLLAAVRKYDDHADQHGYGGFFFWFDMVGRTEATLALAEPALRARLLAQQRELVLALPEFDGCFVDSHELGRAYGTAMALLCLQATAPQ